MKRHTARYSLPKPAYRRIHRALVGVADWDGRRLRVEGYVHKTYYVRARDRFGRFKAGSRGKSPVSPPRSEYVLKPWAVLAAEILARPAYSGLSHQEIAERCGVHVRTLQRALKRRSFMGLVEAVRQLPGTAPGRFELGRQWRGGR